MRVARFQASRSAVVQPPWGRRAVGEQVEGHVEGLVVAVRIRRAARGVTLGWPAAAAVSLRVDG